MRLASEIRAVTFDVGGTLIEPWPSVGHVYAEVAVRFGMADLEPEALNRQFALAWRARRDFNYSRTAWRELVNQTFAGLLSAAPSPACFDAIYERFATRAAWRTFDDVPPTLKGLQARGLRLGIISNWDERLRPLLAELQLQAQFDAVVISCEAGHAKPTPEIFRRAAEELNLPPASVLHIGDSLAEDVQGARNFGMQALLLERAGKRSGVALILSLESLLNLV